MPNLLVLNKNSNGVLPYNSSLVDFCDSVFEVGSVLRYQRNLFPVYVHRSLLKLMKNILSKNFSGEPNNLAIESENFHFVNKHILTKLLLSY